MGKGNKLAWSGVVLALGGAGLMSMFNAGALLNGFSEFETIHTYSLQLAVTAFCFDSKTLDKLDGVKDTETGHDFEENGDIDNDHYTKQSIYALLYSLYKDVGIVEWNNTRYRFVFNTWGYTSVRYRDDPQRHGKSAYSGLVDFPEVKEYVRKNPNPQLLEVGCGTGAGANLITELLPTCNYTALDMQHEAIQTCKNLHASSRLTCVHGNGRHLPVADSSIDIVVISETHITDVSLDAESKRILGEVHRVLKPGGLFVWGNALPTRVWNEITDYLPKSGFDELTINNVTKEAVMARIEDEDRVNSYCNNVFDRFPILRVHKRCRHTVDRLLKNFYRHPGTALFDRMVTGYDSYLQGCYKKQTQPQQSA